MTNEEAMQKFKALSAEYNRKIRELTKKAEVEGVPIQDLDIRLRPLHKDFYIKIEMLKAQVDE